MRPIRLFDGSGKPLNSTNGALDVNTEISATIDPSGLATENTLGAAKTDISAMKADIATMKADLATVKADLATVKANIATMTSDLGTIKTILQS